MATKRQTLENLDPALLSRIAQLSPGGQRWLKTAIITMRSMPVGAEQAEPPHTTTMEPPAHLRKRPKTTRKRPPDMEDIITGKVDAKELDNYPELSEQLEGMGDVIDMLRNLGEQRRKRGEEILRDEILGQGGDGSETNEDDDDFAF